MDITPKTPWKERRIKSGNFLDRKLSADILKVRRKHDSNIREIEKRTEYSAFMVAVCLLGALVLMVVFCRVSHAYTEQEAIKSVIGEAEGEGFGGMLAVSCAIRNRGSLRGVYGLHSPRVVHHRYSQHTLHEAQTAWIESSQTDVTNGATGWGNDKDISKFCSETWWKNCIITAHIGHQWFYKKRGE